MGDDNLNEGTFEIPDTDFITYSDSDSEFNSAATIYDDNDNQTDIIEDKLNKNKNKRKIEELKALKRTKNTQGSSYSNDPNSQTKLYMYDLLVSSIPPNIKSLESLSNDNFITLGSFPEYSSDFIKSIATVFPNLPQSLNKNESKQMGSPKVLIICSSASRSCDVIKDISKILKCKVAKLYAKHFKVFFKN